MSDLREIVFALHYTFSTYITRSLCRLDKSGTSRAGPSPCGRNVRRLVSGSVCRECGIDKTPQVRIYLPAIS